MQAGLGAPLRRRREDERAALRALLAEEVGLLADGEPAFESGNSSSRTHDGSSFSRRPFGSITSRMSLSSSSVGGRLSGTSSGTTSSKPVAATHLVDGHAGVHRAQPHAVVGRLEVEARTRFGDDPADLVEPARRRAELRRPGRSRCRPPRRPARRTPWASGSGPSSDVVSLIGVAGRARGSRAAAPSARCSRTDATRSSGCRSGRSGWRPSSRGAGPPTRRRTSRGTGSSLDDLCRRARRRPRRWRRAAPRRRSSSGRARSVARASRPPIIGMVPIGLARSSPSPRKHSATATAQTSARVDGRRRSSRRDLAAWYVASSGTSSHVAPGSAAHASGDRAPTRRTRAGTPRRARSRARTR